MMNTSEDAMLRRLIDQRTRDWNAKFDKMTAELHAKDEQIELARNRADMTAYARRRIAEEQDNIAPELRDYISGDTREEVEQAITAAKQKTASILAGIREAFEVPAQPESSAPAAIPAQPQQAQPQGGQLSAEQRTALTPFTLAQIAAVEPGSEAHLQMRAAFGIDRSRSHGILG